MVARPREGPDLQKRPPFGAERADPASPAGLSVGTWERNGTKTQSKRQFLHLAMAVGAKLEPRASEAHWSQRRAIYGPPGAPAPPDRPETKGKEQPNEPLSKTPARPRDPNGHSPPRKTLTGSRRGPHRGGEGSPKKSRDNADPHGMVGLGERTITWGLGIGKVRKIWQIRTKTLFWAHQVLRFLDDFVDFCGFRIFVVQNMMQ